MHAWLQERWVLCKICNFLTTNFRTFDAFWCILVEVQTGLGKTDRWPQLQDVMLLQKMKAADEKQSNWNEQNQIDRKSIFWCQFTVDHLHCLFWKSSLWTVTDRLAPQLSFEMYLSTFWNVFVYILECICLNSKMYLLITFIVFSERAACELWPIVLRCRLIDFESRFWQW